VSHCEFYFSFCFRPTPPCCQRRSIALQNAGEMRRALNNITYERKQHFRLNVKTRYGTWTGRGAVLPPFGFGIENSSRA
jgi:hypothetical protein